MRSGRLVILTVAAATALAPAAAANPTTTVQRTIQDCDGDDYLEYGPGERHLPFGMPFEEPEEACAPETESGDDLRLRPQDSILNFVQLSDFQMVDEESPARVEFLDGTQRIPRLQPFSAAYRPQESLTTQTTEAMVRQVRNTRSPVTGTELDLAILTGDNADSQQYNETRWFIDILDGTTSDPRKIDPNSGIPAPGCEATPGSIYDGVRDNGRTGVAPDFGYYEPDSSSGPHDDGDGYSPVREENEAEAQRRVSVRDFPGLFEAANTPFEALGLDLPWYSAFGNHDALVQGNSPEAYVGPFGPGPDPFGPEATEVFNAALQGIATGCIKVQQPAVETRERIAAIVQDIQELREGGLDGLEQEQVDELTGEVVGLAQAPCDPSSDEGCVVDAVPPDPRRCFLAKDEIKVGPPGTPCAATSWIGEHFQTTGTPVGHGFGLRPPEAQRNNDGYYAFSPRPGIRFVVLDTITDECGVVVCSEGSVDDTQFQWLRRQLATDDYVLVFSHHTLRTIRFPSIDATEYLPEDIHYGQRFDRRNPANPQRQDGGETLESLFCRHPNVLAHIAGHEHENYVERYECADDEPPADCAGGCTNPYFWHVSTAAHVDWPQQSRMIELVDLGGEMSLVLTMLDHEGAANPGARDEQADQGHAGYSVQRLASIAREISYNDYQADRGARGTRADRNVILPTDRPPPGAGG